MRHSKFLSRRALLRGAAAGVPLALGLPALEATLDGNGEAYAADGAPLLRRLGIWFFGSGGHWEWTPREVGPLQLPVGLTPLEKYKNKTILVSDLAFDSFGDYATNRHYMGAASVLTGTPWRGNGPVGASLDQVVAPHLNKGRRASLELSITPPEDIVISWSGANSPNRPESDPRKVFAGLFNDTRATANDFRALYVDAVKRDADSLRTKLGAGDKRRLDGYLEGLRDIEKEIAAATNGSKTSVCAPTVAAVPGTVTEAMVKDRYPNLAALNRAMSKILAAALACGHTQVFTYAFSMPNSAWGWPMDPGLANNHHELGHQHHPDLPRSVSFLMDRLVETLDALASYQEGSGTVLDNSGILVTTEVARNHEESNVPTLLIGGGGGALRGGQHIRAPKDSRTPLAGFTLARALGAQIPSYGMDFAKATKVLDGALV